MPATVATAPSAAAPMGRARTDGPTAESVERRLEGRIGASRYRMWFADPTRFLLQGGALEVQVPSRFAADWIERHFRHGAGCRGCRRGPP
ncbi:MAG: DnaA N-terminal domain-containing protein, partial [Phycisphaerales bacterium]